MNQEEREKIAGQIRKHVFELEEWKATELDPNHEDPVYNFNAIKLNHRHYLVIEFYCDDHETERTFYLYDDVDKTMRKCTDMEDDIYRTYDDEHSIFDMSDEDLIFVVAKEQPKADEENIIQCPRCEMEFHTCDKDFKGIPTHECINKTPIDYDEVRDRLERLKVWIESHAERGTEKTVFRYCSDWFNEEVQK